jgi:hypothetical protein
MRMKFGLCLAGMSLLGSGCSPLVHAVRTLIIEPAEYSRRTDDATDCARNKKLAAEAWTHYQAEHPGGGCTYHFGLGFQEGYADYLYAGGEGNPPPVAQRTYWRPEYETEEGHAFMLEWFAGFRAGSSAARASGYRHLVTVAPSVAIPPPGQNDMMDNAGAGGMARPAPAPVLPATGPILPPTQPGDTLPTEELPTPRKVK